MRAVPTATADGPVSPPSDAVHETTPAAPAIAQLETLKARVLTAEMRGAALEAELANVARRLARSDAELLSRGAEREVVEQELSAAREELEIAKGLLAQRAEDVARVQETIGARHRSIGNLRRELEALKAQTEKKLAKVTFDLSEREWDLSGAQSELSEKHAAFDKLRSRHQQLAATLSETKAKLSSLGARLTAEKQAHSRQKHRLKESNANLEETRQKLAALGVDVALLEKSTLWRVLRVVLKTKARLRRFYQRLGKALRKKPSRESAHAELIARSKYFDAAWYRSRYLDGAETELEAALHYLRIGASHGHDPGPRFSSSYYLEQHADVAGAGFNPLLHYLRFGEGEARSIAAVEMLGAGGEPPPARLKAAPTKAADVTPALEEPSRARFEAPLPALIPVRYPLEMSPTEASEPEPVPEDAVPLRLSGVPLGWLRRTADAVPLEPIMAFSVLAGVDPTLALHFKGRLQPSPSLPEAISDKGPAAGSVLALGTGAGCEFADVWFINECDLRARLRATPDRPDAKRVLRCYQYDPAGERGVVLLGEWRVPLGELGFIDIATQNPYCPVLFMLSTQAGEILSLSLLPFPPLCRGGTHYGELLAMAADEAYLGAIRRVSQSLLDNRLRTGLSPPPLRIEVDLTTAAGTERIFTSHLRQWLMRSLNVEIAADGPVSATGEGPRTYLEEAVRTRPLAGAKAQPGLVLSIPADALPSLAILLGAPLAGNMADRKSVV